VSFYGGGIGPGARGSGLLDLTPKVNAPILFFWGGLDKHITPDQKQPIEDALAKADKKYVNVNISFADHAFIRDGGAMYNADAARFAWTLTKDFLERYVKSPAK
jgi:carboxymethylenebutenolidase